MRFDISIGSPMIQVSVNRKSVTEMQAQYDQMCIFVAAATALPNVFSLFFCVFI